MAFSPTSVVSVRAVLLFTGVVVVVPLVLNYSLPFAIDFSASRAPLLWTSFRSWLTPPFVYLLVNAIIITIAATSGFNRNNRREEEEEEEEEENIEAVAVNPADDVLLHQAPEATEIPAGSVSALDLTTSDDHPVAPVVESTAAVVYEEDEEQEEEKSVVAESVLAEEESAFAMSARHSPCRTDASVDLPSPPVDKPLLSARFNHRKATKSILEGGRALGVAKPKRHETLENTWKMITEGRSSGHLKKCDTWENHGRQSSKAKPSLAPKSETFKDRTNYHSPVAVAMSPVRLRKEPTLSQDELNRRVEAFIKRFNEEMRLQRLESLKHYKEMVSRGA